MRNARLMMIGLALGFLGKTALADNPAPPAAVTASSGTVAPTPAPTQAPAPTTPPPAAPAAKPVRTDLNEMKGKFQSKSDDPPAIHVIVDGGFNVEFSYDTQTTWASGDNPIHIEDLNYGDDVIVRYLGKEMNAVEVVRVKKTP